MNKRISFFLLFAAVGLIAFAFGCGGGGGSDSDSPGPGPGPDGDRTLSILVTVEAEIPDAQNKRKPYPGYQVCAFQTCGTTNERGETSFVANVFPGAVGIEFTVSGPEFSAIAGFPLPSTAQDTEVTLLRPDGQNSLKIGQVKFDGVVDTSISEDGFNDGD